MTQLSNKVWTEHFSNFPGMQNDSVAVFGQASRLVSRLRIEKTALQRQLEKSTQREATLLAEMRGLKRERRQVQAQVDFRDEVTRRTAGLMPPPVCGQTWRILARASTWSSHEPGSSCKTAPGLSVLQSTRCALGRSRFQTLAHQVHVSCRCTPAA